MTMSSTLVQSRVKPELKEDAEAIFSALGMSTGDAIRIFLQQTVNVGGLPFQPTIRRPTPPETLAALVEFRSGITHPFTSMTDLVNEPDDE